METDAGTGSDGLVDAGAENPGPVADAGSTQPQGGGENPAWAPFKEQLGEVPYRLIQPTLAEMDKKANERFEAIHKEYEPLKGFGELGVTPDQVKQYQQIIDLMNNDPVTFYNMLGQNPQIAASLQQGNEEEPVESEGDDDPFDLEQNPQFQALQQQNQQMMEMLQERQQQEQAQQMDQQIESEMSEVFGAHQDFDQQDQKQAIMIWANMVQFDPNATLEQAASQVAEYKQSILSTPRPGASAPQVMPTNGSSPSPNSNARMGNLSNQDTRHLVQQMLANQQG